MFPNKLFKKNILNKNIFKKKKDKTKLQEKDILFNEMADNYFGNSLFDIYPKSDISINSPNDTLIYKEIANDPIVNTCERFIRDAALTIPWYIKSSYKNKKKKKNSNEKKSNKLNELDDKIINFINSQFKNLVNDSFHNILDNLLDARIYGFIVAEKVFHEENGKIKLKNIKCKSSHLWNFNFDLKGNIESLSFYTRNGLKKFPPYKFIIATYPYIHNGNILGESEYLSIYNDIKTKQTLEKMRNVGFQYCCVKPIVHYYQVNRESSEIESSKTAIDKAENSSVIHIPANFDNEGKDLISSDKIEILDKRSDPDGLKELSAYIESLEKRIKRKMGIPDDLGFTDSNSGSYSRAKVQFNSLIAVIERCHLWISDLINTQVIPQLINLNYDLEDEYEYEYPQFCFEETDEEVSLTKVELISKLIDSGIIEKDEKWIRDYLGINTK